MEDAENLELPEVGQLWKAKSRKGALYHSMWLGPGREKPTTIIPPAFVFIVSTDLLEKDEGMFPHQVKAIIGDKLYWNNYRGPVAWNKFFERVL